MFTIAGGILLAVLALVFWPYIFLLLWMILAIVLTIAAFALLLAVGAAILLLLPEPINYIVFFGILGLIIYVTNKEEKQP